MPTQKLLKEIKSILRKPIYEKLRQESDEDKIARWTNEFLQTSPPAVNAEFTLPTWIDREEIHTFVQRCLNLDQSDH